MQRRTASTRMQQRTCPVHWQLMSISTEPFSPCVTGRTLDDLWKPLAFRPRLMAHRAYCVLPFTNIPFTSSLPTIIYFGILLLPIVI